MPRIKIGMAGWYERAGLYPSWCRPPIDRLKFYAQEHPIVEVNSYYAIPRQQDTSQWANCTPERFIFDVKAFRLLTAHHTEPRTLPAHVRRELPPELTRRRYIYYDDVSPELRGQLGKEFTGMLDPLIRQGKLVVVLFQFAPWFRPSEASFGRILHCGGTTAQAPRCSRVSKPLVVPPRPLQAHPRLPPRQRNRACRGG